MGAVILLVLWLFHRQIVTVSLDRESARAMGLPVLPWILCCTFW